MRFATTLATLLTVSVGFVAAQDNGTPSSAASPGAATGSSSSSSSSCQAQNILDACLASTTPQLKACAANDWNCLCEQSNNVLTCYNNCPNDPNRFGAEQSKTSYCNAAKANSPSSSASSGSSTPTPTSSSSNESSTASSTGKGESSSSPTSTSSSKSGSSSTGAAPGALSVQAGTLVGAVALALGAAL
ncbi:hypothetical protein VTN96DRAFT_8220 [Rasamsonia emersonii]